MKESFTIVWVMHAARDAPRWPSAWTCWRSRVASDAVS